MDNRKTVLEVNDLVVSFSMYKKGFRKENLEVIHSLSIDVKEKEIVAIVGSSGSGKMSFSISDIRVIAWQCKHKWKCLLYGETVG